MNIKRNAILTFLLFCTVFANAQTAIPESIYAGLPFKMDRVVQPKFPALEVNIKQYGAVADGVTPNTQAINRAIAEVSKKGGGKVVVPAGLWLTGPVELQSNVNLHLESGALLFFSRNLDDYPLIDSEFEGLRAWRCQSPVSGKNLVNIAITGSGIIDGSGDAWRFVKRGKMTEGQWKQLVASGGIVSASGNEWYPTEKSFKGSQKGYFGTKEELEAIKDFLRPVMISLISCKNVLLDGVTFQNSPAWNIHPLMCENLTISNLAVRNPWYSQNGDGLDVESCKNVIVYKSTFDVGDDAICIKSGKDAQGRKRGMPTENMIVQECVVYHGHGGFVVGSEMSGGVRNIKVSKCTFIGTDVGLRFKSQRGRGGVVENIWISDINMMNIPTEPLLFDLFYGGLSAVEELEEGTKPQTPIKVAADETTPEFRNIFISNVTCNGARRAMFFNGLPEKRVQNVTLDNIFITSTLGAEISEASNVRMTNIKIINSSGKPIEVRNSDNVTLDGKAL